MEQLVPVHTGNLTPTCGEDGIHKPLVWTFDGAPVRVLVRPNQPVERSIAWVLTDAAKALGYKAPRDAARSILLVEPEDQGVESVSTPGGPQKHKVLTWKGLTKFLMRSDMATAIKFQDWLASKSSDLAFHGVAFAKHSASEMSKPAVYDRELAEIRGAIADLTKLVALVVGGQPRPAAPTLLVPVEHLPIWTKAEHRRMLNTGYTTARHFLAKETGTIQPPWVSGGLTKRTLAWLEEKGITAYYFRRGKAKVLYLPDRALATVFRTKWKAESAEVAEEQEAFDFDCPAIGAPAA